MPEAEPTIKGQLVIMRMKGRKRILGGCCTRYMLYSVSTHDHHMGS